MNKSLMVTAAVAAFLIVGCSTQAPSDPNNLCSVFQEKDSWYASAHKVHAKYGIPIDTAVAILAQNSKLANQDSDLLDTLVASMGLGKDGYLTVTDDLWLQYKEEAGSFFSDRGAFSDALDFIGWYMNKAQKENGIALTDAYNQYLVYREGFEGYRLGSYQVKIWLLNEASEVSKRAQSYRQQLLRCNLY